MTVFDTTVYVVVTMGADGGTISTNRKFLRAAKSGAATSLARREERENQRAEELTTCAMSGEPLALPVVACRLGYLYNKEAVIRFLLQGKKVCLADPKFGHIRKLRSVVECTFTTASASASLASASTSVSASASGSAAAVRASAGGTHSGKASELGQSFPQNVICPVTLKPMNNKNPFAVIWSSGNVYSLKAIREMPGACGLGAAASRDTRSDLVVALAPSELSRQELRRTIQGKVGSKKRKRRVAEKAAALRALEEEKKKAKTSAAKETFKSANALFTQGYGLGVGK